MYFYHITGRARVTAMVEETELMDNFEAALSRPNFKPNSSCPPWSAMTWRAKHPISHRSKQYLGTAGASKLGLTEGTRGLTTTRPTSTSLSREPICTGMTGILDSSTGEGRGHLPE